MIRLTHRNGRRARFRGASAFCALSAFLALALLLGVAGCSSVPETIEEDLSPAEFFQRAQEASDSGRYELSQKYYEGFRVYKSV